ncbi:MAG: hypothetical protein ACD_28C00334G0001, partial [uncultured bacterium]
MQTPFRVRGFFFISTQRTLFDLATRYEFTYDSTMDIVLSWDLVIILFFTIIIAYSFIIG